MSALEDMQGLIAAWHLRGIEGGYVTVQGVRKWAQEVRESQAEDDDTARVVGELQEEIERLKIANAQLQQQLAISEIREDQLREL